jgi:O-antigen ligase
MTNAPDEPRKESLGWLPIAASLHALSLIVFLSWRFGGMEPFSRVVAGWALLIAPALTIAGWRVADPSLRRRFAFIAVPLIGLAVIVAVSAANPYMRMLTSDGEPTALVERAYLKLLPAAAWPAPAIRDFLFNAGLVLVGLNLFLSRPTRGQQRFLLSAIAVNAAALAAVGTIFKLTHAKQILGTYPSPNENFFATFFYYNHWGGFAILGAAAAAAIAFYYRQAEGGDWLHTPGPFFGVLTIILLVSLPVAGGRASILAGLFLAVGLGYRLIPRRRDGSHRLAASLAAFGVVAVLSVGALWLARDRLASLWHKTSEQVGYAQSGRLADARAAIYRETWDLFLQRPIYGWGWRGFRHAIYPRIQKFDFRMQNEQKQNTIVLDAHNDWLQILAELGLVGVVVIVATFRGIARVASPQRWVLSPSFELILGFVSLSLLACLDFPFACPAVVVTAWTLVMTAAAIAYDREHPESAN